MIYFLGCLLHTVVMVAIGMNASVTSDCHGNRCKQQSMNHQEFKIPDHFNYYYSQNNEGLADIRTTKPIQVTYQGLYLATSGSKVSGIRGSGSKKPGTNMTDLMTTNSMLRSY